MFGIGPVIMQPFPNPTRALSNVGIVRAQLMHVEVLIGAITEELLATRTEVGEPGDELFGRRRGRQFEVNCGHRCSFATRVTRPSCFAFHLPAWPDPFPPPLSESRASSRPASAPETQPRACPP